MLMALIATAFANGQGTPDTRDYLHFVSLKSGCTLRLDKTGAETSVLTAQLEYSTNRQNWTDYSWNNETGASIAFANAGDTVWFRAGQGGIAGTNATFSMDGGRYKFVFGNNDSIAAGGNVMSLYDGSCQQDTMTQYGFEYLFKGCKALVTAPLLPATQMAEECYYQMFKDCSSLTTAPALPAMKMEKHCYHQMFDGCTSLTSASTLPATQLAQSCYGYMFKNCSSLTTAPSLPATQMQYTCYYSMFYGCNSLTTAPSLPATQLATSCYDCMFEKCSSLTTAPALPATEMADYCYNRMFYNCTSLTAAPALHATKLETYCYSKMFNGCTSLNVDTCGDGSCSGAMLVVPDTTQAPGSWNENMFSGCKGSYANNISIGGSYCITEYVDTNDYLHFVSLKGGDTLRLDKISNYGYIMNAANLEYSTDDRKNWTNYTWNEETGASVAFANVGDVVWFRAGKNGTAGANATFSEDPDHYFQFVFGSDDSIAAGGNTMSLLDGTCQKNTMIEFGFHKLFYGCKALTKAPSLPATTLNNFCYDAMFKNCTSLKIAPTLQATTLGMNCYNSMFSGCTSLKIDTCDGICAGAMLVIPNATQAPLDWNYSMFTGCQGDSKYTAYYGIKIGGCYCIMGTGFTLTVEANDTTMGSVTGSGIYDCGDTVTITATAKAGYKFVGWSTGESAATYTFIMFNQDSTITATFALASGVEEIEVEKYVAYAEAGSIIVNGVAERSVAVYDMSGRMVGKVEKANETERFAVGISGVYVVAVDNKAEAKVVVK